MRRWRSDLHGNQRYNFLLSHYTEQRESTCGQQEYSGSIKATATVKPAACQSLSYICIKFQQSVNSNQGFSTYVTLANVELNC